MVRWQTSTCGAISPATSSAMRSRQADVDLIGSRAPFHLSSEADVVTPQRPQNSLVSREFARHERIWRLETQHMSSPTDRYVHKSYARIIGLGQPAVPLILRSMQRTPGDWFYALRAITGENPVTNSIAGNIA